MCELIEFSVLLDTLGIIPFWFPCIGFIGNTAAVKFIVLYSARISTILLSNQAQKFWFLDLELCAKLLFM